MKLCSYCGTRPATTSDHVPPKGFFPDPLPNDMVTVPSCQDCNKAFSHDEEYVRNVIASGFQGDDTSVGYEVFDTKVLRSLTRRDGTLLRRVADSIKPVEVYQGSIYVGRRHAIDLESERYVRVMEKIARGLFFVETGRPLGDAGVFVLDVDKSAESPAVLQRMKLLAAQPERGQHRTVFCYKYMLVENQPQGSVWAFQFYGNVQVMVLTYPMSLLQRISESL